MSYYTKKNAEKIEALKSEILAKRTEIETYDAAIDNILAGIPTNKNGRQLDLAVIKARKELTGLELELTRLMAKTAISDELAAAAANPAPAKKHIYPNTRKDSHGY